jgi:hypothetical protein
MRKDDIIAEDALRKYMNPGKRVEAPEGFSSKVMTHIYIEEKPVRAESSYRIPVVFGGIFLALVIITVLFVPAGTFIIPDFKIPFSFNFSFPEFKSITGVPPVLIYLLIAVLAFLVLDSALGTIFRRERK